MTVQGIDVSNWQGAFNWTAWTGKIGFGLAKACEGDAMTDADFGHNWDSMWSMNATHTFPRFAYLFFHAGQDPVVQAAHLIAAVKAHGLLPGDHFVLDLESTSPDDQLNDGLTPAQCAPRAVECLHHINSLAPDHRVLPYMNPAWAESGGSACPHRGRRGRSGSTPTSRSTATGTTALSSNCSSSAGCPPRASAGLVTWWMGRSTSSFLYNGTSTMSGWPLPPGALGRQEPGHDRAEVRYASFVSLAA